MIFGVEAAGAAAKIEPFELLRLGDVGAGREAEYRIGRLLVVHRDHLQLGAVGPRNHHARHVDEADIGRAGLDGLNDLCGALGRDDRDVEAFLGKIAFGKRRVPRGVPSQRNEVEGKHKLRRRRRCCLREPRARQDAEEQRWL